MTVTQKPKDLAVFALGTAIVIGSFSPWLSIAVMSVGGTDGWRGFVTLTAGLLTMIYGATHLWPNLLDVRLTTKLKPVVVAALLASMGVLLELAIRLKQVANEFSSLTSGADQVTSDSVLGDFTNIFDDFAKSLVEALNPRIALGWYLCIGGSIAALALVLWPKSETQSVTQLED